MYMDFLQTKMKRTSGNMQDVNEYIENLKSNMQEYSSLFFDSDEEFLLANEKQKKKAIKTALRKGDSKYSDSFLNQELEFTEQVIKEIQKRMKESKIMEDKQVGKDINIYQVTNNTHGNAFMSWDFIEPHFSFNNYSKVATIHDVKEDNIDEMLETIFSYGNSDTWHEDYPHTRSISVSDIIQYGNEYYYVDTFGFKNITEAIKSPQLNESFLREDRDKEIFDALKNEKEVETIYDLLVDRIGQEMTLGELNTVLQSIFGKFDEIFLLANDLYNADTDGYQELIIEDDDDELYTITFKIIDLIDCIIEITDIDVE